MRSTLLASLLLTVGSALFAQSPAADPAAGDLVLHARSRVESPAQSGQIGIAYTTLRWAPQKTAIIVCDMWDQNWCKAAVAREIELVPRMNDFLAEARKRGVLIVHAPSDCMKVYEGRPGRQLAQNAPSANLPDFLKRQNSGLDSEKQAKWPIDQSDGGCDCATKCTVGRPWRKQIDSVKIADGDAISDSGLEIGNLFAQRGIDNVMLVGVHENMCVIGRSFGLRNMVRLGKNVLLVRDLTDVLYNSRMAPHVSRLRGTDLVTEHIERYVCPTITSSDLLGGPAFRFQEDKRPHVAFISSEDQYFSERTFPAFAQLLSERYGCYCTMALGRGKPDIAGLDELKDADVAVIFARRQALPKEQLDKIRAYLDAGKPLVGLRTCSHAFVLEGRQKAPPGTDQWPTLDHDVLGGNYRGHFRNGGAEIKIVPEAAEHPILAGLTPSWATVGTLYRVSPLSAAAKVLVTGSAEGTTEPVAWTHSYRGGRVFYTQLGHQDDFAVPQFCTLLVNGIFWAMDRPVPKTP